MAAFLTATSTVATLKGVEDFAGCGLHDQPECIVDFGVKKHGSTIEFFKVSAINNDGNVNMFK